LAGLEVLRIELKLGMLPVLLIGTLVLFGVFAGALFYLPLPTGLQIGLILILLLYFFAAVRYIREGIAILTHRRYIELEPIGFSECGYSGERVVRWNACSRFDVHHLNGIQSIVFVNRDLPHNSGVWITRFLTRRDHTISGRFELSTEALCEKMNLYRNAALSAVGATAEDALPPIPEPEVTDRKVRVFVTLALIPLTGLYMLIPNWNEIKAYFAGDPSTAVVLTMGTAVLVTFVSMIVGALGWRYSWTKFAGFFRRGRDT
jgi:hypothetical protein